MSKVQTGIITKQGQYAQKQYLDTETDYKIIGWRVLDNYSIDINIEDDINYSEIPATDVKYIEYTEDDGLASYMMNIYRWDNNSLEIKCFLPSNNESDIKKNGSTVGGSINIREYQILAEYSDGQKFILYIGRFANDVLYDGSGGIYFKAQIYMSSISKAIDFDNSFDDWSAELYNQQHDMVEVYIDNILGADNDNIERGRDSNNPYNSLKRAIEEIPQGGWGSIYIKDNGAGNEYNIDSNVSVMRKYINFYLYDDEAGDKIRIKRSGNYRINLSDSFLHFGDDTEIDENSQSTTFFFSRNSTIEIANSFKPILTSSDLIDGYSFYFVETDSGDVDISSLNGNKIVNMGNDTYFKYRLKSGTLVVPATHFNEDCKIVVKSELDAVAGDLSNYYTKIESDGRYLNESENLNDLPNKATARTNLAVYSKTETDNLLDDKADLITGGTNGNIVTRNASGNIQDSGKKVNDSGTSTSDLWTASKINTEISNLSDSIINFEIKNNMPIAIDTVGDSGSRRILAIDMKDGYIGLITNNGTTNMFYKLNKNTGSYSIGGSLPSASINGGQLSQDKTKIILWGQDDIIKGNLIEGSTNYISWAPVYNPRAGLSPTDYITACGILNNGKIFKGTYAGYLKYTINNGYTWNSCSDVNGTGITRIESKDGNSSVIAGDWWERCYYSSDGGETFNNSVLDSYTSNRHNIISAIGNHYVGSVGYYNQETIILISSDGSSWTKIMSLPASDMRIDIFEHNNNICVFFPTNKKIYYFPYTFRTTGYSEYAVSKTINYPINNITFGDKLVFTDENNTEFYILGNYATSTWAVTYSNILSSGFMADHIFISNGYQILPSGLIIQWGRQTVNPSGTFNFPITFPNSCLNFTVGLYSNTDVDNAVIGYNISTSQYALNSVSKLADLSWIAIGH